MQYTKGELIALGGIKYLIREVHKDGLVLTTPFGVIRYDAPVKDGKTSGLPITRGLKYFEPKKR